MHQFHDVLVSFAERREIYMNKYYNDENHYIGTFTILDEEIDGEIICNKKTGEIFLDLAKQLDEKSFMGKSYANMPVISGKINSGAFVTLFFREFIMQSVIGKQTSSTKLVCIFTENAMA